jgi:hypothetical protein
MKCQIFEEIFGLRNQADSQTGQCAGCFGFVKLPDCPFWTRTRQNWKTFLIIAASTKNARTPGS